VPIKIRGYPPIHFPLSSLIGMSLTNVVTWEVNNNFSKKKKTWTKDRIFYYRDQIVI